MGQIQTYRLSEVYSRLTDGGYVYDVLIPQKEEDRDFVFHCVHEKAAHRLAQAIDANVA